MPESDNHPTILPSENGPYIVKNLEVLRNSRGEPIPTKPTVALCRCGGSANKPFCDGTHKTNGFSSEKLTDGRLDKREDYVGDDVTIHDNRGICAHIGNCTSGLPAVFRLKTEPWIHPNAASGDEIITTVRQCPSGALSHSVDGVEYRDQDREPVIIVSKDGPYFVQGGIELPGVARGEGASTEHYTLCRCGASKNKPFCDGSHWSVTFTDEKN